jgi:hypothetical protein
MRHAFLSLLVPLAAAFSPSIVLFDSADVTSPRPTAADADRDVGVQGISTDVVAEASPLPREGEGQDDGARGDTVFFVTWNQEWSAADELLATVVSVLSGIIGPDRTHRASDLYHW